MCQAGSTESTDRQNYLYQDEVDQDALVENLFRLCSSTGDPYTVYYNKDEQKALMESAAEHFPVSDNADQRCRYKGSDDRKCLSEFSSRKAGLKAGISWRK